MIRRPPRSTLFPTRRSSDLTGDDPPPQEMLERASVAAANGTSLPVRALADPERTCPPGSEVPRSEEHTSELQSHLNLVCRLLLEKKKRKYIEHIIAEMSSDA